MSRDREADRQRNRATLRDHSLILQQLCVYCGSSVSPKLFRSGNVKHLDHFVPIKHVITARRHYPAEQFANFLLPSCPVCNNFLGSYFFASFADKFDFLRAIRRHNSPPWRMTDNPSYDRLKSIVAPSELLSIIKSMDDFRADVGDIVLCPQRLENGL
jgi:hypothetical protein